MGTGLAAIEQVVGHAFADKGLLTAAFTHASYGKQARASYERLEFLGDRVLGLVVADALLRRFPREAEGDLAKRQAALIQRDTLANVARDLGLGAHLRISKGEEHAGGRDNPNLLADMMEALMAALYLDGGLPAARAFIAPLWDPLIAADKSPPKDAKSALQERTQALRLGLPTYDTRQQLGPDHSPTFVVGVRVAGHELVEGEGPTKREAEQAAAARLLARLS